VKKNNIFEVDVHGMRAVARQRGLPALMLELWQNAIDEQVTEVAAWIGQSTGRHYRISMDDNSPDGFRNLAEAYTLYAPSYKRDNPEKRGFYNVGEKFVIAACNWAEIHSTTGYVRFDDEGRHNGKPRQAAGTRFIGELVSTQDEVADALDTLRRVIVPDGVTFTVNGEEVQHRTPIATIPSVSLPTVIPDNDGVMRPTRRPTRVSLYEPLPNKAASLYEMGVPVVRTDDRFDINVAQRVVLSGQDRSNVVPSYLAAIRVLALNAAVEVNELDADTATSVWVAQASSDKRASDEAIRKVMDLRFGTKRVSYDPSDPEANKRAVEEGYAVIAGRTLSAEQWALARRANAIKPAGQVTPSNSEWKYGDGPPERTIAETDWTPGMRRVAAHARWLAFHLLYVPDLQVRIVNEPIRRAHSAAAYSTGSLIFNAGRLGFVWFDRQPNDPEVLELLIHEFGHHYSSDHLDKRYHDGLSSLGAHMVQLALDWPERFTAETLTVQSR
jgi:hypothetical protein